MSFANLHNSANSLSCCMLQDELGFVRTGIMNLECAVLPPSSKIDTIPFEATDNTISPLKHNPEVRVL